MSFLGPSDDGKSNECSQLNGGCEHICVPTPKGHRCACWDGFNAVGKTKCFITTRKFQFRVFTMMFKGKIAELNAPCWVYTPAANNVLHLDAVDLQNQVEIFHMPVSILVDIELFDLSQCVKDESTGYCVYMSTLFQTLAH